jgi:hypothetical protein
MEIIFKEHPKWREKPNNNQLLLKLIYQNSFKCIQIKQKQEENLLVMLRIAREKQVTM